VSILIQEGSACAVFGRRRVILPGQARLPENLTFPLRQKGGSNAISREHLHAPVQLASPVRQAKAKQKNAIPFAGAPRDARQTVQPRSFTTEAPTGANQGKSMKCVSANPDLYLEQIFYACAQRFLAHFHPETHATALCHLLTDEAGHPVDLATIALEGATERMLGLDKKNITEGKRFNELFPTVASAEFDRLTGHSQMAIEKGESTFELYFSPTRRWLSVYAYRSGAQDITLLFYDITHEKQVAVERRKLLDKLYRSVNETRQQKNQLSAVIESLKEGICVLDMNGDVIMANTAQTAIDDMADLENMSLNDARRAIGHEFSLPTGEALAVEQWPVSRVLRGESFRDWELRRMHPATGRSWHLMFSGTPIFNEQGQQILAVLVTHDVTERKQLRDQAAELRVTQQAAAAANDAKTTFLATMSHEMRTPLNAILGFTSQLLEGNLSQEQRRFADLTRMSGEVLLALVNDLLDYSKIEAGQLVLEEKDFSPHQLVKQTAHLVEGKAQEMGLQMHCLVTAPQQVRGDAGRLRQILLNLLSNAVKFTFQGHVTLRCHEARRLDSTVWLRFSVTDTGIGMTPEMQRHLFQPFQRADSSSTRRFRGTGLGLAICKRLTEALGGNITVTSILGIGSTFMIELPFELAETPQRQTLAAPDAQAQHLQSVNGSQRVLVVEDNPPNQLLTATLLRRMGYHVDVADDGEKATAAHRARPYDLILMDCEMPVMDGFEATRTIRAAETPGQHVPIIATTALALKSDKERCFESGMDDFLAKPMDFQDLRQKVEVWLSRQGNRTRPGAAQVPARSKEQKGG
jgi:signal transduction histidine kinase/FixJ family two-component response regulator